MLLKLLISKSIAKDKLLDSSINAAVTRVLFCNLIVVSSMGSVQADEVRVLPSITVYASRSPDNDVIQRSEVEWNIANDPSIKKESDGVYTVGEITTAYNAKSLILSLGSPAVNFDITFAKNSATMTADGRATLSTLIDTLGYLNQGTVISITPINSPIQNGRNITQRRLDSLRASLLQQQRVTVKFLPNKAQRSNSTRANEWRIRVRRELK